MRDEEAVRCILEGVSRYLLIVIMKTTLLQSYQILGLKI